MAAAYKAKMAHSSIGRADPAGEGWCFDSTCAATEILQIKTGEQMPIIDLIRYVNGKAITIRCVLQIIRRSWNG